MRMPGQRGASNASSQNLLLKPVLVMDNDHTNDLLQEKLVRMLNYLGTGLLGTATAVLLPIAGWNLFHNPSQSVQAQSLPTPAPTTSPIPIKPDVPYVPTPESVVSEMLKLAQVSQGDVLYDLGSGDGRLVITAVKEFKAQKGVGIEISPSLVKRSQANAEAAGVSDRVQFLQQDLFKTNFSEASVVTLYLLPEVNVRLRPILLQQLRPGTRIVSHSFSMGDWQPDKKVLVGAVPQRILYFWVVPANVAGEWRGELATAPGRRQPYTLQFTQTFQQVNGTLLISGQKIPIQNGTLDGDRLRFKTSYAFQGQPLNIQFLGQVQGNTLKGVADVQSNTAPQQIAVTATRSSRQATSP